MDRSALIGIVALAGVAGGAVLVASLDGDRAVVAAPGDVTLTAPRIDTSFQLEEICLNRAPYAAVRYRDGSGRLREVVIRNGESTGYDYAADRAARISTPTGFTDFRASLGVTNARIKAAVDAAKASGVLVVPGTVQ